MKTSRTLTVILWGLFLGSPAVEASAAYVPCVPGDGGNLATASPAGLTITVHAAERRQTIRSFGASDCWSIQHIGLWPDAKRNAIADLLFQTDLDANNRPRGIGLSLWRFNLGGGSSRQTKIRLPWRRADCFFDETFSPYDWSRCEGQRWFLQAAKARGVEQFLAFVVSPPINMTKNGRGYCDTSVGSTNLDPKNHGPFSTYLADVMAHFRDVEKIDFAYLSPLNEPQWDWNARSQEGCRYSNADIKQLVDALHPALQKRNLKTQILLGEAGAINHLYEDYEQTGNQIDQFFDPDSGLYLGNQLARAISAHSYWTDTPASGLVSTRRLLRQKLDEYPGLEYAMTEYCILGSYGPRRDLGIDPALYIARTIHYDLTVAEANSWQWWLGVSPHNYKDGLVYVDKDQSDGAYYTSKILWAMGNFSRFLRPGAVRLGTARSDNAPPEDTTEGLMVSAYRHDDGTVVLVLVNWSSKENLVAVNAKDLSVDQWIPYLTSATADLTPCAAVPGDQNVRIPPRSVVTLVGLGR